MFNLIVSGSATAWETDQLMRMAKDRFREHSGHEAGEIEVGIPSSLTALEKCPTLLMYEMSSPSVNRDMIRYGKVQNVIITRKDITFRFQQEGIFSRAVLREFG